MPKIKEHRLKSLPHYVELVQDLQKDAGHTLWFRGNRNADHSLLPSLYRHPKVRKLEKLRKLERDLMTRFRQRSVPYRTRDLADDWEALFFMQHYGVPTRLLDWTEHPLIGLHFALVYGRRASPTPSVESVVWVVDPVAWNRAALRHVSYQGGPLATNDEDVKGYLPTAPTMSVNPVALYGVHNSPRIVAQQGAFLLFGSGVIPMDALLEGGSFPQISLYRIVIAPSNQRAIRKSLLSQGVTETAVFPDLEGLAQETRRHFGFEG